MQVDDRARLRASGPADWEALRDVRLRALREDAAGFCSTYDEERALTEADWRHRAETPGQILASREGRPCGIVLVLAIPDGGFGLRSMWVAPTQRGTGLADALVHAALADAVARGATSVELEVFEDNIAAARVYRRHGFIDAGADAAPAGRCGRLLKLRWSGDATGAVPTTTPAGAVRHTGPAELRAVIALEASTDTREWLAVTGAAWHEAALADPDQRHLVLTRGERVVGFATLAGSRRTDRRIELRRMVLDPALRGSGAGRALLEAACRYAVTALGAGLIWLDVRSGNAQARALYTSAGFTPYDDPPAAPDPALRYLARRLDQ